MKYEVKFTNQFKKDLKLAKKQGKDTDKLFEQKPVGIWGQRHRRYLKQNHKVRYYTLLTSGKLNNYLADIDEQAEELFSRVVKDLAEKEGVTERLKADDQMEWVRRMNSVRNRAAEVVNADLIYA